MELPRRQVSLVVYDIVASTNESILEAGLLGALEGTTHMARAQTRGRGRAERRWWSPAGAGLWMSTLLRPSSPRRRWGGIAMIAGAAAHDAVKECAVPAVRLYWPNDLQVGGRKLGGILGEVRSLGSEAWVALGVGINIDLTSEAARADMPPALREVAISLVEAGAPATTDPVALGMEVLRRFWPLYDRFLAGDSVRDVVGERLAHRGGPIEVRRPGKAPMEGTLEGLGPGGELEVRPRGGGPPLSVLSADVIYRDAS
jgi:BirA family biotin operon repressor/biotin-[acetyl-CoA-carboxylase] ligase